MIVLFMLRELVREAVLVKSRFEERLLSLFLRAILYTCVAVGYDPGVRSASWVSVVLV